MIVKNEFNLNQFNQVFDYTTQNKYECQVLAMGSNKTDFLHDLSEDHGVETLLYEPLITTENQFDCLHNYNAKTMPMLKPSVVNSTRGDETKEQSKSMEVIQIVNAKNTSNGLGRIGCLVLRISSG
jgi:hypothetical protein